MKYLTTYWRTALIAILFIAVLVFMLKRGPRDDSVYLWDLKAEQIASIQVEREGSAIRLSVADGHWSWEEADRSIAIDDEKFNWRLEMLLHPQVESRLDITADQTDVNARYGLKPSEEQIVITDKSGRQYRLAIGSRTPLQRHYYVRLPQESAILLIPVAVLTPLLQLKREDVSIAEATELHEDIPEGDFPAPAQSPPQ